NQLVAPALDGGAQPVFDMSCGPSRHGPPLFCLPPRRNCLAAACHLSRSHVCAKSTFPPDGRTVTDQDMPIRFSPEVADALSAGRPPVALESTIVTHGMPWPENVATARL